MSLKTIDTIRKDGKQIFKIKQDDHEKLYVETNIFFLHLRHSHEEYKKNKKDIIQKIIKELGQRNNDFNKKWNTINPNDEKISGIIETPTHIIL